MPLMRAWSTPISLRRGVVHLVFCSGRASQLYADQMRVCMDLSVLRTRPTGVGYYGLYLAMALLESFPEAHQYFAFDGLRTRGLADFVQDYQRKSTIGTDLSQSVWNATAPLPPLRIAWRWLKRLAFSRTAAAFDLVHAITYAPPARGAAIWLPLIHDLSYLRFPQFHPRERVRWCKAHDSLLSEAPLINTVSEFTKNEIVTLLRIAPNRIRVTHPGVNPAFGLPPLEESDRILSRYGIKAGRFLLSVATIAPQKNLDTIAAAFARLPQKVRDRAALVFVGQPGWDRVVFPKTVAHLRRRGEIRFIGYVPIDHLRALYQNTALFLYPSLYEGFGIPVAEAHLAGAAVAIAAESGTREAGCGLALEIPAINVDEWTRVMKQALESDAWRDEKARAARSAAGKLFTWYRNALLTSEIYAEIASRFHGG
jgi:glycosyltransferase involved in cell wall biosynthesis